MSERKPPTCPCCAGHGAPLGALGHLHWFRCRDCGYDMVLDDTGSEWELDDDDYGPDGSWPR